MGVKYTGDQLTNQPTNPCDFRQKSPFISETVWDSHVVTMDY